MMGSTIVARFSMPTMRAFHASGLTPKRRVVSAVACAVGLVLASSVHAQSSDTTEVSQAVLQDLVGKNQELLERINNLHRQMGFSAGDNTWYDYENQVRSLEAELGDVRGRLGLAEIRMAENAVMVDNLREQHRNRIGLLQNRLLEASNHLKETTLAAEQSLASQKQQQQAALEARDFELQRRAAKVSQAETEQQALRQQIAELTNELNQTSRKLNASSVGNSLMTSQLQGAKQSLADAAAVHTELQQSLAAKDVQAAGLQSTIDSLRSNLGSADIDLLALDSTLEAQVASNKKQSLRIRELESQVNASSVQASVLSGNIIELQQQLASSEAAGSTADNELNRFMAMNSRLQETALEAQQQNEQLQAVLDAERLANGDVLQSLAQARKQEKLLAGHISQIGEVTEKAKARNRKLKQLAEALTDDRIALQQEKARLENINQVAYANIQRLSSSNEEKQNQLAQAAENRKKFGESLLVLSKEKEDMQSTLQSKHEALEQLGREKQQLLDGMAQLEQALQKSKVRQNELTAYLDETRSIADQAKARHRKLKGASEATMAELEKLKNEQVRLIALNETLNSDNESMAQQNQQKLAEMENVRVSLDTTKQNLNQNLSQLSMLQKQYDNDTGELNKELSRLLDEQTKAIEERDKLASLANQRARDLLDLNGKLESSAAKQVSVEAELQALRSSLQAPVDAANKMRATLRKNLKEAGIEDSSVRVRDDHTVALRLPNEFLFRSGRARLTAAGRKLMDNIAKALDVSLDNSTLRVEGHTDSVPLGASSQRLFPSNWELSVARSANAVSYLQRVSKIDPVRMSASGFGEFRPIAENTTPEGRLLNRRIEIVVIPE